ncbi:unnamed protein product [Linum trigynum]
MGSSNFYVPSNEEFSQVKRSSFHVTVSRELSAVVPATDTFLIDWDLGFPQLTTLSASTSPNFPFCKRKLVGEKFFYVGYDDTKGKMNQTLELRFHRDSDGHSTHKASIVVGHYVYTDLAGKGVSGD